MGRVCPKGAMTTPRHDNRSIPVARETIAIGDEIKKLMKTYAQYPPRKIQSESYTGPITISQYERLQSVREMLAKEGVHVTLPTGN